MAKAEIELTDEQMERLKTLEEERGVPAHELMRQAVEQMLRESGGMSRDERWARLLAAAGKYNSGLGDLAENHDKYLAEAYAERSGSGGQ